MLTGKKFRVQRATLALDVVNGDRKAITIPVGAIIKVISGPTESDHMVNVTWEGKIVEMFAIDVDVRGTEISEPQHAAI